MGTSRSAVDLIASSAPAAALTVVTPEVVPASGADAIEEVIVAAPEVSPVEVGAVDGALAGGVVVRVAASRRARPAREAPRGAAIAARERERPPPPPRRTSPVVSPRLVRAFTSLSLAAPIHKRCERAARDDMVVAAAERGVDGGSESGEGAVSGAGGDDAYSEDGFCEQPASRASSMAHFVRFKAASAVDVRGEARNAAVEEALRAEVIAEMAAERAAAAAVTRAGASATVRPPHSVPDGGLSGESLEAVNRVAEAAAIDAAARAELAAEMAAAAAAQRARSRMASDARALAGAGRLVTVCSCDGS